MPVQPRKSGVGRHATGLKALEQQVGLNTAFPDISGFMDHLTNRLTAFVLVVSIMCFMAMAGARGEAGPDRDASATLLESLTATEKNWLKEHPVIRVGGPKAFPPFHYYDGNGQAVGVGSEYAALIMKQLGVELRYEPAAPWPEVLEKMKTGRLDVIACAAKSPGRETYLAYSRPYLSFPLVIITRQDESFIGGLQDLHGKRVALVNKVMIAEWLLRDGINVTPRPVESPVEALKAVSVGRADAAIENLAAAYYLIQKNGLFNLKVAAPTDWGNYRLFLAVRKDWPILTSIIDKALENIPPERKTAITDKWITVRYEFGIAPRDIARWVVVILIPIVVFVGFILIYNRRLRREIRARQMAEREREQVINELQTALSNIKQLKGLLPICASCKKIRDDQGYWQQVEEYLLEHSEAEFSHSLCPDCIRKLYPDIAEEVLNKITAKHE